MTPAYSSACEDPDKAIEVELRDERHGWLVVEVEDRDADLATIKRALCAPPAE